MLGVFTSSLTRNMIKGLASEGWMYYLGKLCFLLYMSKKVHYYLVVLQSLENSLDSSDCAMKAVQQIAENFIRFSDFPNDSHYRGNARFDRLLH